MTVTERPTRKLVLTGATCRHAASRLVAQCGLPGVDTATEDRLKRAAVFLMNASDGKANAEACEVTAPLESFLWLQKRFWKSLATDKVLWHVVHEISVQLSREA